MAIFADRPEGTAEKQQGTHISRISILKFTCIVNIIRSNELRVPRHPRLCSDRFFVRRRCGVTQGCSSHAVPQKYPRRPRPLIDRFSFAQHPGPASLVEARAICSVVCTARRIGRGCDSGVGRASAWAQEFEQHICRNRSRAGAPGRHCRRPRAQSGERLPIARRRAMPGSCGQARAQAGIGGIAGRLAGVMGGFAAFIESRDARQ